VEAEAEVGRRHDPHGDARDRDACGRERYPVAFHTQRKAVDDRRGQGDP
jgi:hypothetical protein